MGPAPSSWLMGVAASFEAASLDPQLSPFLKIRKANRPCARLRKVNPGRAMVAARISNLKHKGMTRKELYLQVYLTARSAESSVLSSHKPGRPFAIWRKVNQSGAR